MLHSFGGGGRRRKGRLDLEKQRCSNTRMTAREEGPTVQGQ